VGLEKNEPIVFTLNLILLFGIILVYMYSI
jgi:hypothetical protein